MNGRLGVNGSRSRAVAAGTSSVKCQAGWPAQLRPGGSQPASQQATDRSNVWSVDRSDRSNPANGAAHSSITAASSSGSGQWQRQRQRAVPGQRGASSTARFQPQRPAAVWQQAPAPQCQQQPRRRLSTAPHSSQPAAPETLGYISAPRRTNTNSTEKTNTVAKTVASPM